MSLLIYRVRFFCIHRLLRKEVDEEVSKGRGCLVAIYNLKGLFKV